MRKFLFISALTLASPAWADDKPKCDAAVTQSDMTYCAAVAYQEKDRKLNEVWPTHVLQAKESDKLEGGTAYQDALITSQRAWITFRDAECNWQGFEAHGGSLEPMLVYMCKDQLTSARIKQLEIGASE